MEPGIPDSVSSIITSKAESEFSTSENLDALPTRDDCKIDSLCDDSWYQSELELADLAWELAYAAYSCLVCTPFGLPGRGMYVWPSDPGLDSGCCDSLVSWFRGYKPVDPETDRWWDDRYVGPGSLCGDTRFVPELVVSLFRPCRPIFNSQGTRISSAKDRNEYGYKTLVDVRTLTCCLRDCLANGEIPNVNQLCGDDFYFGRVTTGSEKSFSHRDHR